ncbi:MAG: hypothetical protein QXE05_04950 [Nitrososphaeria archaeon]
MEIEEKVVEGFNMKLFYINRLIIGVPTEVGPRILYLASESEPKKNLFGIYPDLGVETVEGFWKVYGGHRLWSSPEAMPRSYSIDDKPVKIEIENKCITVYGNPEEKNSIRKEIVIKPYGTDSVQVVHRIRNIGRWPIKLACWALSLMEGEGFVVIPIKASKVDNEGLLPDRHITLWPYTDLSDRRLKLTNEFIFVSKNSEIRKPIKIGTMAKLSWSAYIANEIAFIKEFSCLEKEYPDFNCNVEVYTNANLLEFETLSHLESLAPSATIEHTEIWKLVHVGLLKPEPDEIKGKLEPLIIK